MQIVVILGLLAVVVGNLWLIVLAFKESVLWGLGTLFLPLVGLVFAITRWQTAKLPFLIALGGLVLCIAGAVLMSPGASPAA